MQLFEAGDDGVWVYIIEKGQLEASVISLNGRELTLAILFPGVKVGEIALDDDVLRNATVSVANDCTLVKIARIDLTFALAQDASLEMDLLMYAGQ